MHYTIPSWEVTKPLRGGGRGCFFKKGGPLSSASGVELNFPPKLRFFPPFFSSADHSAGTVSGRIKMTRCHYSPPNAHLFNIGNRDRYHEHDTPYQTTCHVPLTNMNSQTERYQAPPVDRGNGKASTSPRLSSSTPRCGEPCSTSAMCLPTSLTWREQTANSAW